MYVFKLVSSPALALYSGVKFLDHIVVLFLIFWGTSTLFSTVAAPIYIPTNRLWGFRFPHSHQHLLLLVFLMIAILIGMMWHLTVILICISLMTNDVEHLSMYLLAICMSSLEKFLFISSVHFLSGLFVFLILSSMSCLYIMDINALSVTSFENIFSHSVDCIFCFMDSFLCCAKVLKFN